MPYTKTRDRWLHFPWSSTGLDWNGDHQSSGRGVFNAMMSRTGESNPKWKEQVKRGENATTPMTGFVLNIESKPGEATYKVAVTPGGYKYTLTRSGHLAGLRASFDSIDWVPISATVAYNRGLTSYLKQVNQVNQALSGMVVLGELRETLRMIRNPALGLRNILNSYYSDLKAQKKKRPKQWKKNLSGTWLEYSFGMVPLINDIADAAKAYNRLSEEPKFVPVSGFGREDKAVPSRTEVNSPAYTLAGSAYGPALLVDKTSIDTAKCKFRGYVRRDIHSTPAGAVQLLGFDPWQFVPAAWELMPWSFLIDYFSNIGDVLESTAVDQSKIAWTNVSTVIEQTSTFNVRVAPPSYQQGSDVEVSGRPSTAILRKRTVVRTTPSTIGLPTVTLELPGRPAQFANMTALFAAANSDFETQRLRKYSLLPRRHS